MWYESHCTRADWGFFFLLGLEPVMTTRCFVGRIRYSFENWVKKKVIRGESKSGRKESLFPKGGNTQRMAKSFDTTKDSWITQELGESLSLLDRKLNFWTKLNLISLIRNGSTYIEALTIRVTKRPLIVIISH